MKIVMPKWYSFKAVHRYSLLVGWSFHLALLILFGFCQEVMRSLLDANFNTPLMWLFHEFNQSIFTPIFMTANKFGGANIVVPMVLTLLVISLFTKQKTVTYRLLSFGVGLSLMVGITKKLMISARPQLWPYLENANGSSFPSSHAAASIGLAVIFVWLVGNKPQFRILIYGAFFVALLTGCARIYIGVHRPSDVLLAWLIAISWAFWIARCFPRDPNVIKPVHELTEGR